MSKLPIFVVVWIAFLAIKIPTVILGAFVVPLLWRYRSMNYSDLPGWTRPWANPEDWMGGPMGFWHSLPRWWVSENGGDFKSFYRYHAIRNPANGLRSFEWADVDPNPEKIEYRTPEYCRYYEPWYMRPTGKNTYGYICWQGYRAGVKFVHHWNKDRHFVFKFGWRIEPRDKHEPLNPDGIRHEDAGFATKLILYRKG